MPTRPEHVDVTIRIDRGAAARLDEIVQALEASGVTNLDLHRRFLIVNGAIARDRLDAVRRIDGVASVREDRAYKKT